MELLPVDSTSAQECGVTNSFYFMSDTLPPVLTGPRRVVTSHDSEGKAVVSVDETVPSSMLIGLDGLRAGTFWASTDGLPTNDNNCPEDGGTRRAGAIGLTAGNMTKFKYTDIGPGVQSEIYTNPIELEE
ncbi:hypothetical protein M405DRAFT_241530 [Rhizopogon salebrosus TDB-379]|nr:hypothetical protein M405DRAFT_241530 [Rhizopogon salebrosus TDB-379]